MLVLQPCCQDVGSVVMSKGEAWCFEEKLGVKKHEDQNVQMVARWEISKTAPQPHHIISHFQGQLLQVQNECYSVAWPGGQTCGLWACQTKEQEKQLMQMPLQGICPSFDSHIMQMECSAFVPLA